MILNLTRQAPGLAAWFGGEGPQSLPPIFGSAPERPIIDRATFLPVGQYEDGSLTLAWPGIVKDTYDSLFNSYADVAAGRTPKTSDVLNVATAPVMGNLAARAVGAMPEGALGVGASKPPVGNIKSARPESDALTPKAEAMGKSILADDISKTAEDAFVKRWREDVEANKERYFNDWEEGEPILDAAGNIVDIPLTSEMFEYANPYQNAFDIVPATAAGINEAAMATGTDLFLSQSANSSSHYGTLIPPSGRKYKVRVADHSNVSSQFDAPDFNIAPGEMTPEEFVRLMPHIFANAPEGSLLPLGVHALEQAQQKGVLGVGASKPVFEPLDVLFASRNAKMFDPPSMPQRAFEADYPKGARADAEGRITHDIDGAPLSAAYVAGRRTAGGADVGLSPAEIESVLGKLDIGIQPVPASAIKGDAGRYVRAYDRGGVATRDIRLSNNLDGRVRGQVLAHEAGHAIDELAAGLFGIPTDGLKRQLGGVYNTLNNPNRARDGSGAATWSKAARPEDFGYRGDSVPAEFIAEAIRAYMTNPNYLKSVAPETAARIREYVNSNPRLSGTIQFNANAPEGSLLPLGIQALEQAQRPTLDALGFYSALDETLKGFKPTDIVTADTLAKRGVKKSELEARGLSELLADGKAARVADLQDVAGKNKVEVSQNVYGDAQARWRPYSLDPDNPAYRETVLHLPSRKKEYDKETYNRLLRLEFEMERAGARRDFGAANQYRSEIDAIDPNFLNREFRSAHWDEPNVIAHARTSIQKDAQGNDVFVVNELQSDWGQTIRDYGARGGPKHAEKLKKAEAEYAEALAARDAIEPERVRLHNRMRELKAIINNETGPARAQAEAELEAVSRQFHATDELYARATLKGAELRTLTSLRAPPNPLVNTTDQWVNTGLRKMIMDAVESGADQIAIPSGETVKAFGMGGEEAGLKYAYDQMYPKNLRNILRKIDPSISPTPVDNLFGSAGGMLERSRGFTSFPITPAVREAVEYGLPLFANAPEGSLLPLLFQSFQDGQARTGR